MGMDNNIKFNYFYKALMNNNSNKKMNKQVICIYVM